MLATLPCRLVGMDDGFAGTNGDVLGITRKTHQQQITGRSCRECNSFQAGLTIERSLQLSAGWAAPIARHIKVPDTDLTRDVDGDAGTIESECDQPSLMMEWRAKTLARSS